MNWTTMFTPPNPQNGEDEEEDEEQVLLSTAPGMAVVGTGCGKTVIGQETLRRHNDLLREERGRRVLREAGRAKVTFGNDTSERPREVAIIPAGIMGRAAFLKTHITSGDAPLLLSKSAINRWKRSWIWTAVCNFASAFA